MSSIEALHRRVEKLETRLDQQQGQEDVEFETCWADEEVPGEPIFFRTEWARLLDEGDEDEEHYSATATD